jgi:hypothetical protein
MDAPYACTIIPIGKYSLISASPPRPLPPIRFANSSNSSNLVPQNVLPMNKLYRKHLMRKKKRNEPGSQKRPLQYGNKENKFF